MNRNMIMGWVALFALLFGWTQYKAKQVAQHNKEVAQQLVLKKADSLAKASTLPRVHSETALVSADKETLGTSSAAVQNPGTAPIPLAMVIDSSAIPRQRIRVVSAKYSVVFDNLGSRISELSIPNLEGKTVHNPILIRPEREGALSLTLDQVDMDLIRWQCDKTDTLIQMGTLPIVLNYTATLADGRKVVRRYTVSPDGSRIHHEIILPERVSKYSLEWKSGLDETEKLLEGKGVGLTSGFFSEVVFDNGGSVNRKAFEGFITIN